MEREYNLNDGSGWQSVENGSTLTTSNARHSIRSRLRYNPGTAGKWGDRRSNHLLPDLGSNRELLVVWRLRRQLGYHSISLNSETASITVSSLNDAPVIVSANDFSSITEDDNQGSTPANYAQLSSLITVSDVDTSAPNDGIAIVAQTATNGVWKYSLDEVTWGTISISTGALVLDLDDYVAFVPDAANGGTSTLEFRAWDQYSDTAAPAPGTNTSIAATGGTTAFSSTTSTIEIFVSDINDAPVWPAGTAGATFASITEDETTNNGDEVSTLLKSQNSDDDTGATSGIAVFNADVGTKGTLHGSTLRTETTGVHLVRISWLHCFFVHRLHRFVPDGNGDTNDPYIDFYVWDGSHAFVGTTADVSVRGGTDHTTNFSEESGRSSIDVSDLNDPPTLSVETLYTMKVNRL